MCSEGARGEARNVERSCSPAARARCVGAAARVNAVLTVRVADAAVLPRARSTMVMLELPHVSVLSKVDKIPEEERGKLDEFLHPDARLLMADLAADTPPRLAKLNNSVAALLDDYSLVSFLPLDVKDEDTVAVVLMHADEALQFGENQEPQEHIPPDADDGNDFAF